MAIINYFTVLELYCTFTLSSKVMILPDIIMRFWAERGSSSENNPDSSSNKVPNCTEYQPIHHRCYLATLRSGHLVSNTEIKQFLSKISLLSNILMDTLQKENNFTKCFSVCILTSAVLCRVNFLKFTIGYWHGYYTMIKFIYLYLINSI